MLAPNGSPRVFSDNNLINGKMNFDCSTVAAGDKTPCVNNAGISKFKFKKGKTHRLRLINSGADGVQRFSIDEHTFTVIANDFTPIKPYNTTVVTLGVGQRVDVLVTANAGNSKSSYWMRSNLTVCTPAKQPYAVAAVYYEDADTTKSPASKAWNVPDPGTCANDDLSLTEPLYPMAVPKPTHTHTMQIELFKNASDVTLWKFGGVSMRANYNEPILLQANEGNFTFPEERNVVNFYSNSSVRVVVINRTPGACVLMNPTTITPCVLTRTTVTPCTCTATTPTFSTRAPAPGMAPSCARTTLSGVTSSRFGPVAISCYSSMPIQVRVTPYSHTQYLHKILTYDYRCLGLPLPHRMARIRRLLLVLHRRPRRSGPDAHPTDGQEHMQ